MNEKLKQALKKTEKIWICQDCLNTPTFKSQKEVIKHHIEEHQGSEAE